MQELSIFKLKQPFAKLNKLKQITDMKYKTSKTYIC